MDPISSPEVPASEFSHQHRLVLNALAWDSIQHGLSEGVEIDVVLDELDTPLQQLRGSFITLKRKGELRGCVGTIDPQRPLVQDVAKNAYGAAFKDPRFPPLNVIEFTKLELAISVLSHAVQMSFTSEEELLQQIRPRVDGLILTENRHRGTFLPAVWESLRDPRDFLVQLKKKAGLPAHYWSDSIRVERYTTESWIADTI
ncbi:MAG: AmmeMemoRadiSam system protein A [Gammaproteobacteria bacterium]|nr:AmmeMemoRadiSam system protein A [Gammaproteobacteria bacterium]